jgi:hypothetical protein
MDSAIRDYRVFFAEGIAGHGGISPAMLSLRRFTLRGSEYLLVLDTESLRTSIIPFAPGNWKESDLESLLKSGAHSSYARAMTLASGSSKRIYNAGYTRLNLPGKGFALTADLCPSRLPMDRRTFTAPLESFPAAMRPLPVAVAITGKWIGNHGSDLRWLLSMEKDGLLSITWMNHSYNHWARKSTEAVNNFLLRPGTDFSQEILETEIRMIESGITPTVFFRFPGLCSGGRVFMKIRSFGLMPVGSDSWLAKNQWPKTGSIVLVHGNGNEPEGIHRLLLLLQKRKSEIASGELRLMDLREGIISTASGLPSAEKRK